MPTIDLLPETEAIRLVKKAAELLATASAVARTDKGKADHKVAALRLIAEARATLEFLEEGLSPQTPAEAVDHLRGVVNTLFAPLPPRSAEVVQFNVTRSPDRDPTPPRAA